MKKLLLGAAAAALAAATAYTAAAAALPNYDAALSAPTISESGNARGIDAKGGDKSLRLAGQKLREARNLNRNRGYQDQLDSKLGVATFVWARGGAAATPLIFKAEKLAETGARDFLSHNASKMGLSKASVAQARLIDQHDLGRGPVIARFQQTHGGIEVFGRRINVMMDRNLKPVASSGYFAPQQAAEGQYAGARAASDADFSLGAEDAIAAAFADLGGQVSPQALTVRDTRGGYTRFAAPKGYGDLRLSGTPRAKKVYYPAEEGLAAAWYAEIKAAGKNDTAWYAYVISAGSGKVLFRKNLVENEAFTYRTWADADGTNQPWDGPLGKDFPTSPLGLLDPSFDPPRTPIASSLVTLDHSPISTGDPWLTAAATETVGNNVDAYLDAEDESNADSTEDDYEPALGDFRADITSPLSFDYALSADDDPTTGNARKHAIVNLFYINNWLHDFWYDHGFTETDGNAQADNYGRGGVGGDPIQAQAQDFSGRNNANMGTPADGGSPRMQMYLFDGLVTLGLIVTAPALGEFDVGTASFGPTNFEATGTVSLTTPANGCAAISENLTGKIALIDRGVCSFETKVNYAEDAGAIGVIIANTLGRPKFGLGRDDAVSDPSIGSVGISNADGDTLKASLGGTMTAQLKIPTPSDRDGTLDNGIVAHEFFHYVSNRLVGDGSGLVNIQGRGMGEGWSDFNALLLTVREGDDLISGNEDFGGAYSSGGYVDTSPYFGIRRAPYSVNPDVFPMTFKHIEEGVPLPDTAPLQPNGLSNAEVHNSGEIWANALWTVYVALLNDPRYSFTQARERIQDYVIAGLKMTPFAPTFLEARDGVLAAALATDRTDFENAAKAFAKAGMGVGAVAPDRFDEANTGVQESFLEFAPVIEVTGVSFDFAFEDGTQGYKDLDGILDVGETALLSITIRNNGTADLEQNLTANISSDGDVTFGNGGVLTFNVSGSNALPAIPSYLTEQALPVGQTYTGSIPVTLNSATSPDFLNLLIEFPETGATAETIFEPGPEQTELTVNYDVLLNSLSQDDVETPLASDYDWTQVLEGGGDNWFIANGNGLFGSGLGWYVPDNDVTSDVRLTSPVIEVADDSFQFSFDYFHRFEFYGVLPDGTPVSWDGGLLEISIDGGAWTDVLEAGGDFTEGGYNGYFFGHSYPDLTLGFAATSDPVNLGLLKTTVAFDNLAGKSVRFRFRALSDSSFGEFGWFVDDITVVGVVAPPFSEALEESDDDDVNRPPHAIVPAAFSTPERAAGSTTQAAVTLPGSANDLDGLAGLAYLWTQTAGPAATLTGAATATASFTASYIDADAVLTFSLKVTDPEGLSDTKSVSVSLLNVESAPVVTVPAAFSTPERAEGAVTQATVTLAGGASDPDDPAEALAYAWTQTAGPTVALTGAATATASFVAPRIAADTVLTFLLTVTDETGLASTQLVTVTLLNVNAAPVVNAGANKAVSNGSPASLTGTATDADGEALTLLWTQTGGPAVTLSGVTTTTVTFTPEKAGTLTFQFAATDTDGVTSTSTTTITVEQAIKDGGGGSFGWLMILAGLLGFAGRRIRRR